jgi:hypothetical protein
MGRKNTYSLAGILEYWKDGMLEGWVSGKDCSVKRKKIPHNSRELHRKKRRRQNTGDRRQNMGFCPPASPEGSRWRAGILEWGNRMTP